VFVALPCFAALNVNTNTVVCSITLLFNGLIIYVHDIISFVFRCDKSWRTRYSVGVLYLTTIGIGEVDKKFCAIFSPTEVEIRMVQVNYNFTIPCVNLHGHPQCHEWLLLRGICVPHSLTYMNVELCNYSMHYSEAMHVKHAAPMETQIVSFVRQQFSLTLIQVIEWKDQSDIRRTGTTSAFLRLAFCIVIMSSSVTNLWQSCKIMWNHVEKLITIALNIFCTYGLFSVEFLFTTYHKAWFHAKSHVVFCMEFHVCMKL